MKVVYTAAELKNVIPPHSGFVPTMGALHEGHLSLVRLSNAQSPSTVVSIFVNPTQFNDPADFEKYPVTIEKDLALLEKEGCAIVFIPSRGEIYPAGYLAPHYELGYLENILEGKYRPGHFQGVCQVMDRLLRIVEPARLFLGSKDYQQCLVIKKLISLLQLPVEVIQGSIVREPSGLAMSSRNARLSGNGRQKAAAIFHALQNYTDTGTVRTSLLQAGFEKIDYVEEVDGQTLLPPGKLVLVAAFLEGVRLIDNHMCIN